MNLKSLFIFFICMNGVHTLFLYSSGHSDTSDFGKCHKGVLKRSIYVRHTSPNKAHVHTPCVMLPNHHTNVFIFLTNFKIIDFNKEHTNSLKMV